MGILNNILADKDEVWRKFSKELNGQFIEAKSRVEIRHKKWTITLDSFGSVYGGYITRVRAPFISKDGFKFKISRKSSSRIGRFFGVQQTQIGFSQLDDNFTIKGNDKDKLKQLLENSKIRNSISSLPIYFRLDIKKWLDTYFPEDVCELYFEAETIIGAIKDINKLKILFKLVTEILDQLCHIGSASEDDPKVNVI